MGVKIINKIRISEENKMDLEHLKLLKEKQEMEEIHKQEKQYILLQEKQLLLKLEKH